MINKYKLNKFISGIREKKGKFKLKLKDQERNRRVNKVTIKIKILAFNNQFANVKRAQSCQCVTAENLEKVLLQRSFFFVIFKPSLHFG